MGDVVRTGIELDFSSSRKAARDLKGLEGGWKKMKKTATASIDSVKSKLDAFTGKIFNIKNALIGFAGLRVFQSIKDQVLGMTAAYETQIAAEKRLGILLDLNGVKGEARLAQLKKWAAAMQENTVYGDEQTLSIMQQGLAMGVAEDRLEDFALAVMRLTGGTGGLIQLDGATRNLAKT